MSGSISNCDLLESYSMTDLEDLNTNEETFIVKKCFLLRRKVTNKQTKITRKKTYNGIENGFFFFF